MICRTGVRKTIEAIFLPTEPCLPRDLNLLILELAGIARFGRRCACFWLITRPRALPLSFKMRALTKRNNAEGQQRRDLIAPW